MPNRLSLTCYLSTCIHCKYLLPTYATLPITTYLCRYCRKNSNSFNTKCMLKKNS